MSARAFRFLDLPAELRCMVYKAIDVGTRKEKYKPTTIRCKWNGRTSKLNGKLIMYRRILPISILATCRLVNHEAAPIIAQKSQLILKEPVRFYMDWTTAEATQHVLYACFNTSVQPELPGTRDFDSMWQFIKNCRSYLMAIADARPVNTTAAHVEVTVASIRLGFHRMGFNSISWELFNICETFSVSINMLVKEDPRYNSRIDAAMPAQPGLREMVNWRTKARRVSGISEVRLHDMDDDEWADHMQMLKEL